MQIGIVPHDCTNCVQIAQNAQEEAKQAVFHQQCPMRHRLRGFQQEYCINHPLIRWDEGPYDSSSVATDFKPIFSAFDALTLARTRIRSMTPITLPWDSFFSASATALWNESNLRIDQHCLQTVSNMKLNVPWGYGSNDTRLRKE